jgi:hypothetical protein
MTKIIGFSGAKQSGKTTCSKFLHGYQMRLNDVVEKFLMDEEGNLVVNATQLDENGNEVEGLGILDIERKDNEFMSYANVSIWPHVKPFSFADPLKIISMQLFGLTEAQCYGTDNQKNTTTSMNWEDMPDSLPNKLEKRSGAITAREFLQYFRTDICRKMNPNIWVDSCVNRIYASGTDLAIVPDIRFPNEVEAIQKAGGKIIRLTRKPHEDSHVSETALDGEEANGKFDYILDNAKLSMDETNIKLMEVLRKWGWLTTKSS